MCSDFDETFRQLVPDASPCPFWYRLIAKYRKCLRNELVKVNAENMWHDVSHTVQVCGMNLIRTMLNARYLVNRVGLVCIFDLVCFSIQTVW